MADEEEVERSKTGVPGLDEIMDGGIPKGHIVLVSGTSGSGKTTVTTQFLYNGAVDHDEKGLYFSISEPVDNIKQTSRHFGMDFDEGDGTKVHFDEENNLMRMGSGDVFEPGKFVEKFKRKIEEIEPERVVLDSITKFAMVFDSAPVRREKVNELTEFLREQNITTCFLSELPYSSEQKRVSKYEIIEFVVDGVIILGYERKESSRTRTIEVFKMRRTNHSSDIHPLKITDRGIMTYPNQTAF